jgi:hypothetical protein
VNTIFVIVDRSCLKRLLGEYQHSGPDRIARSFVTTPDNVETLRQRDAEGGA